MSKNAIDELRETISQLLSEGLKTQIGPVPETLQDREAITDSLRELDRKHYEEILVVAGFADHPVFENRCAECMYYVTSSRWCALPEIALPVEPEWWCRLWRI